MQVTDSARQGIEHKNVKHMHGARKAELSATTHDTEVRDFKGKQPPKELQSGKNK